MTRLFNDPATFTEDMLEGFLDANSDYVVGVPGGVVRAQETRPGKVAVVVRWRFRPLSRVLWCCRAGVRRRRRSREYLHISLRSGGDLRRSRCRQRCRRASDDRKLRG